MVSSLTELAAGAAFGRAQQGSRLSALMSAQASGNRIARAMDDIASLSAATGISSEVSGLRAASINVAQASSMLQVADGGMKQISALLERMQQLSVQANNGALNDAARAGLNREFEGLREEVNRIATQTNFNSVPLLDGSLQSQGKQLLLDPLANAPVTVQGASNDALIDATASSPASVQLSFASLNDIAVGNSISIGDGAGGQVDFVFVAGDPASATQIQIADTLEGTLQNAAAAINQYNGANDAGLQQVTARRDGNALLLEGRADGPLTGADNATPIAITTSTAGSLSAPDFNGGAVGGIDARAVTGRDVVGGFGAFEVRFAGQDRVDISVQIGESVFRASNVATQNAQAQLVQFTSAESGSFTVQFAAGQGSSVASQADANGFGARLDAALSEVRFAQPRAIANATPSGLLADARFEFQQIGSDPLRFENAFFQRDSLAVQIGKERLVAQRLGDSIGARERVVFVSEESGAQLTLVNGANRIDLTSAQGRDALLQAFESAFEDGTQGGARFQIGSRSDGALQLGIANLTAGSLLLDGLNLLSADASAHAGVTVGAAINTLTSQRADVGAFQQALGFAANNIEIALQNQEAARSVLSDTDFAAASTEFSLLAAAQQASTDALAQTNRLQANLLKLIQ
jgi:flagellin